MTFSVGLDRSGVSQLPVTLALPAGPGPADQTAMDGVWRADVGGELHQSAAAPSVGLEAPFTDDTRAVALAAAAPSYVAPVGSRLNSIPSEGLGPAHRRVCGRNQVCWRYDPRIGRRAGCEAEARRDLHRL